MEVYADIEGAPDGSTVVWRIADAPGGVRESIRTVPPYDDRAFTVRGTRRLALQSIGAATGEGRIAVSLEKGGRRLITRDFLFAIVHPVLVHARLRIVKHERGGSRRAELRERGELRRIEESVNRILSGCGVALDLRMGDDVNAADDLFDRDGRFHPIALVYGKKAKSDTLTRLLTHEVPGVVDLFWLRDLHWIETLSGGYAASRAEHSLSGVGVKDGFVLLDDSADEETLAHEFGHVLGLEDLGSGLTRVEAAPKTERRRLMFSVRSGRIGLQFTWEEFRTARRTAERMAARQWRRRD
jgi:hypothetical protein